MDKSKDHHNHHHHHQSSRLIQPPNSLELANSNVVTEHQTNGGLRRGSRETNGKESMNSIGTCSIDIDCTNYANNRKNYVYTSISEKSIGSLNKYGSSEFDTNTSGCLNGSSSRLPSYVGISCAISGYSSYSRFCASTRNSHSHGNSPTCRYFDSDEGGNKLGINDDGLSSRASIIKSAFSTGRAASAGLTLESQALSTKTESQADEIDGDGSSLKEKSLLQQKIESLYGKSFATGWRDSRLRHRPGRPDLTIVQRRSPSCPPKMVEAKVDVNDKAETRPVFRHVTKAFLEQLETKSNKSGESSRAASATKKSNEQLTNRRPSITVPNTEISQINGTSPKAANYESISSISSTENKEGGNIAPSKINGTKCEEGTSSTMEPSPATVTPTDPPVTGPGATTATERKDGNWFLKELNSTCEDIKKMVDEVNQCIEVDSSRLTEELNGKLLSFVGKANLLLSQKLNQFRELTLKNINQKPEDEYPTKIEDLEGFWEMVLIQINEIKNIFVEILMLKANNWEISCGIKNVNEGEPKTIRSPGKRKKDPGTISKMPARTGAGTVKLEKISAAREEARKNRRREARRLQAAKQQAEGEASTDILLFVPSDKMQSPKMTEEEKEKASEGRSDTEQEEAITTVEAEIVSVGDKQLETTGDGTRKDDEDQGLEYSEV